MSVQRRRPAATAAGLLLAAVVGIVVARARGGATYELTFGTALSDAEALAIIAAAVIAAVLVAGVRWTLALLVAYGVLVVALGVAHPCEIAFQHTPQPSACSASAIATALGLYAPIAAVACAGAAGRLAGRARPTGPIAAGLLATTAVALLASLSLPWYRATDDGHALSQTGWSAFQRLDIYLAVVAAAGLLTAASALRHTGRDHERPAAHAVGLLALSAAGLVFYRLFTAADPPSGGATPLPAMFVALGLLVALASAALAIARAAAEDR